MKNKFFNRKAIGLTLIIVLTSASLFAQRGGGYGKIDGDRPYGNRQFGNMQYCSQIPNLSSEQQQKITGLQTANLKEMNSYRNDLMIKRAELNKLQTENNADINKINAKIDEIGKLKTEMAKNRNAHIQSIRGLLTDDQRAYFDARSGKRGTMRGARNGSCYRMN
ncbi:MAG: Spy/CpxP family protein refolding chaperone [Bacteroidales bacterium]|nr:Spy/CpxP family protein refolding chaperone [Bacteroidales bacterium]